MASSIGVNQRINKLFSKSSFDAVLIMNTSSFDPNFLYLTGFTSGVFERALLIVTSKGEILLTNSLEYEIALRQKPKGMQVVNANSMKVIQKYLKKYLKGKVVGISGNFLPYNSYKRLKKLSGADRFVDATKEFYRARSIKENSEIKNIKTANVIIKKALRNVQKFFKEGITEKQIASKVDELMVSYGATGPSFPTIVCFGANSSMPHHMPDTMKLSKNSFVLIDCGAKYNNYCSDVTRTFIFKPDMKSSKYKKMQQMYNVVKEAQKIALESIKPGVKCGALHDMAAGLINTAQRGKYKGKFIHSLGHAIGIEVHDLGPGLYPKSDEIIKEGMVFSDEPGIYISGFGGVRIEDDVVVTKKGGKII